MKKNVLLLTIILCSIGAVFSQPMTIYGMYNDASGTPNNYLLLAEMDAITGSITELDTISEVYAYALSSSTFDQTNQQYIFKGMDNSNVMKLLARDVVNDSTVYSSVNDYTINDFQYDMNTQNLYALGNYIVDSVLVDPFNNTYQYEYASRFLQIDVSNSVATELSLLPNIRAFAAGNSSFDANSGRYIVGGYDSSFNEKIFVIDAATGTIQSQTFLNLGNGEYLNELEFNNEDDKLYGIYRDNSQNLMAIARVDIGSGQVEVLQPLANAFAFIQGGSVFHQASQRFAFFYLDYANQSRMLVYDVSDSLIISDVAISGTLAEIEVDNSAYAQLKYGTNSIEENGVNPSITIFPNPAKEFTTIRSDHPIETIQLFDITGKEIFTTTGNGNRKVQLELPELYPGIFVLRINTGGELISRKLSIRD
ncbi:MAG: T9SS type A sorting domain-containing protein [Bacteroidales bacterium]|nr:T9SS type A sorting domain-containing protein [Bacteroidales bacterium]MCF8455784.1 T9SS type A sorting domain-containing protein [Bacteroidales bacterium]